MRRVTLALVTLVLVGSLVLGCSGSGVPPDKQAYVGAWVASNMRSSIEPGGGVSYERNDGGSRTEVNAPIQGFSASRFEVGVWIFTTDFLVSVPPHLADDGKWHMTVDGVDRVRVNLEGVYKPSARRLARPPTTISSLVGA